MLPLRNLTDFAACCLRRQTDRFLARGRPDL